MFKVTRTPECIHQPGCSVITLEQAEKEGSSERILNPEKIQNTDFRPENNS